MNNLYRLTAPPSPHTAAIVLTKDECDIWHRRLGHLNVPSLTHLFDRGMVFTLPDLASTAQRIKSTAPTSPCHGCLMGKQLRSAFVSQSTVAVLLPSSVSMSISWPTPRSVSLWCSIHHVIVDDCTRYIWIRFLRYKSQALEQFGVYQRWAENQHSTAGHRIRRLRCDNGGEFNSKEVTRYLTEHGIEEERTTPSLHSKTEWWREGTGWSSSVPVSSFTLLGAALKQNWAEAAATAVYLLNRRPSSSLIDMTPYQAWTGVKPDLSHLRVFGSLAHVQVSSHKRDKLDATSFVGVLVGFSFNARAYRILRLPDDAVIESRDVVFDERVYGYRTKPAVDGGDSQASDAPDPTDSPFSHTAAAPAAAVQQIPEASNGPDRFIIISSGSTAASPLPP